MRIKLCFWIFLIHFLLVWLGVDLVLVSGQCQSDQREILIQLKDSLQFNSSLSTKLVYWNQSAADCCKWPGVDCNPAGQVIGLDLNNETIAGGIDNSSLYALENLESLNLAINKFNYTRIPARFGNLTSLKYLNLSRSEFAGQVPGELSQLKRLVTLDLSSLFFKGVTIENPNFPVVFQGLGNLTELYLDGVNMSAHRHDWCHVISSSLPNLRVLSLSNCYLSGPIDPSLSKLQSLSIIRLSQNNLSAPIPEFFADFRNLTALSLGFCNLQGRFPDKIMQVPTLKTLDLSNNAFLNGSLPEFPQEGSLQKLVLPNTNFSGQIPESVANLKMLSWIELPKSNFSGPIPEAMANLTQLSYLDLSSNNFSGTIPSFQLCKNLTHIDLSRNSLLGSIPPQSFKDLLNLNFIDLRYNAFNGSIPSSLFSLPLMRKIQLSNNNFDGPLAEISNASASLLDTLDFSSNKLEGSIPLSFFELGKLNVLSLSYNNLSGTILTEVLRGLNNLTVLDLSYNNLTIETSNSSSSPFPQLTTLKLASCNLQKFPNLRNQSRLMILDISNNKIGGEIPRWIWNASYGTLSYLNLSNNQLASLQDTNVFPNPNLNVLDLHSNLIGGEIPIPPQTAAYVDYSNNRFNSSIPENIGENLNFSIFFSVSNNRLTGPIPETICNASYLQVLDLSNNGLSGRIPPCLIKLSGTLGVLNLASNNLGGEIDGTFPETCALKTLDLHGNSIEGRIPDSLANCTMLEVLNLGNNSIKDTFPCFLKNNINLRVLVLRSNKLDGDLDCEDPVSTWQKLQIVDIASNQFTGSLPPGCFLKWSGMINDKDGDHLRFRFLDLNQFYYQDTVTVTVKGLEVELLKILTLFTSIDISNNRFSGEIPSNVGQLKALRLFNASHNALTGSIPPSLGNLSQLESLDLSVNKLTGMIPSTLAMLFFLSALNLSYNDLEGRIPQGFQFQTFGNDSYIGNTGLCGYPLAKLNCSAVEPTTAPKSEEAENGYDWQFIFTGLGFGVGAAIITGPLIFCKQGRECWDKYTDKLADMICLAFGIQHASYVLYKEEENDEKETADSSENSDESDYELESKEFKGRYCVYCTKLDFSWTQAMHNPKCSCFDSTPVSSPTSSSSSETESPFSEL